MLGRAVPGFLCFRLEDEAFVVMPPPPFYPGPIYPGACAELSELRGELCLTHAGANMNTIEMWMCDSIETPQWDRRYTIQVSMYMPLDVIPIVVTDGKIVFKEGNSRIRSYDLRTKTYRDVLNMEDLRYDSPTTGGILLWWLTQLKCETTFIAIITAVYAVAPPSPSLWVDAAQWLAFLLDADENCTVF
jgi:hypothetical protein